MLRNKERDFENQQGQYQLEAKEYLNHPKKTEHLLTKAFNKAKDSKNSLGDAWDKLKLLIELIRAYSKGEYRDVSKGTILTVIGAIIYFVSPVDLVPDFIAGLGLFDDAAVIGYTIKKISTELDEFKNWQAETKNL